MATLLDSIKGMLQGLGAILPANKANKGVMLINSSGANAGQPVGYMTKENLAQVIREELATILNGNDAAITSGVAKLPVITSGGVLGASTNAILQEALGIGNGAKYVYSASSGQSNQYIKLTFSVSRYSGIISIGNNGGDACVLAYTRTPGSDVKIKVLGKTGNNYGTLYQETQVIVVHCHANWGGISVTSSTGVTITLEDSQGTATQITPIDSTFIDSYSTLPALKTALNINKSDDELVVDLGLPSGTLWATRNIDVTSPNGFAQSPYQYGCSFFSWGNTDGHSPGYNWGNSNSGIYANTHGSTLTSSIELGDDAGKMNLGGYDWRMPKNTEFSELFNSTYTKFVDASGTEVSGTNKLVTVNGVVGIRLMSKINGKTIFFPASGHCSGTSWNGKGTGGDYWSSTYNTSSQSKCLFFSSSSYDANFSFDRYLGFTIRPVMAYASSQIKGISDAIAGQTQNALIPLGVASEKAAWSFGQGGSATTYTYTFTNVNTPFVMECVGWSNTQPFSFNVIQRSSSDGLLIFNTAATSVPTGIYITGNVLSISTQWSTLGYKIIVGSATITRAATS